MKIQLVCRDNTQGFTYERTYEGERKVGGKYLILDNEGKEHIFHNTVVAQYFKLKVPRTPFIKVYSQDVIDDFVSNAIGTINKLEDKPSGANNGGKNNFYLIPDWVTDCDLLAEYLKLDPYESNVLKTLWINLGARHDGTSREREINKRVHYAQQSKDKFRRNR